MTKSILPCIVTARYEFNGAWWLVLEHKETRTSFRRPELNFEKPDKGIKIHSP